MSKMLILGAHGQIARVATELFLERTDAELTLYLSVAALVVKLATTPGLHVRQSLGVHKA